MAIYGNRTEYILINKDRPVLSFLCSRNEFDEPTFQELFWHVAYRPIGYKSLTGFLERRKAPKHREHIQRLLERFGCDDLEVFINVTHAVSLNDTFWVKKAGYNEILPLLRCRSCGWHRFFLPGMRQEA